MTPRNIDSVNALDAPPKPVLELSGRCIDRFVTCRRCTLDPDPPCLAPTATCVVMRAGAASTVRRGPFDRVAAADAET
ncbi:MAG TPA: hypothetical protein VG758_11590, partial [Hyphomicrobiaceae bacterium]|nr:hypothetical protein [Hyphomicrobiaceae bacterium]